MENLQRKEGKRIKSKEINKEERWKKLQVKRRRGKPLKNCRGNKKKEKKTRTDSRKKK